MSIKRIVLIPHWVQDILSRNKMPLSDCLNVGKIKPVMALSDLLCFAALQKHMQHVFGSPVVGDELYWLWLESVGDNAELRKFVNDSVMGLSRDPSYNREVYSRLFEEDSKNVHQENAFITYDLSPEVVGVVIHPGFFVSQHNLELQKSLVKAILKVLYVYAPSHEVAKTPLFKRYLELLNGK